MSKLVALLNSRFRLPVWTVLLVAVIAAGFGAKSKLHRLFAKETAATMNLGPVDQDISTGLMSLAVTQFPLPGDYRLGAIEWLDTERLLVADGAGRFALVDHSDGKVAVSPLPISLAIDRAGLASYGAQLHAEINLDWLRLNDIVLFDDRRSLAVSYTQWNAEEKCYALVVAVREVPADWRKATNDGWREAYRTRPCLKLKPALQAFAGQQSGGRIVDAGNGKLWLSVGDFEFDGREGLGKIAQDDSADYGKILEIDAATGAARHLSIGIRNPQGLALDDQGRLWSTEHGPRGGDELNLIVEGQNYGWPDVSMGVDYELLYWPLAHRQGRHDGYRSPTYAWLPSVGISQLIQVRNFADEWDGDLLVGSLPANILFRLRLEGDVVKYAEPIKIGQRVRDLVQDPTGTIWAWSDNSILARIRPGLTATARALSNTGFRTAAARCAECHEMSKGSGSRITLAGIVGRPVASTDGIAYSQALRSLGGVWTEERLDAFLKAPGLMAPGTPMAQQGVGDELVRAKIIEALKALK